MTEPGRDEQRQTWTKPELRRSDVRSSESGEGVEADLATLPTGSPIG